MRNAFADEMTQLVDADPRLVLLSGDIGNRLFDRYKEKAPDRFYNCGVAEANMMGVAAGLGMNGFRPVVYTITPFTTTRCFEQIRVDVCYHESPVIIVGTGAGLSYAQLGPTHHSLEDIAILRTLPGMAVLCPCDPLEVRACLRSALKREGPTYIRLGKKGEPELHSTIPTLEIGKAITMRPGDDVCLVGTGNVVSVALEAAEDLKNHGIAVRIENFHSVKPLDESRLSELVEKYKVIGIIEEHSKIGGLYSAISEWQSDRMDGGTRLLSFSLADEFIHRVGTQQQARERAKLTAADISCALREAL
ncbi:MAG: transketolase C-terminal domain-containing protein [Pseudomonadota bacterium]